MVTQINKKADSPKRRNIALSETSKMGIEGFHVHDTPQCESVGLEQTLTAWKHELERIYRLDPPEQEKALEFLVPYALTVLAESGPEAEEAKEILQNLKLKFKKEGSLFGRVSQPLPSGPSTQEVIDAYLIHMEDEGAAEGYLTVRARKVRFFGRQYPELPTSPETIRVYLRQFKTRDVPTRQDQWKALSALYNFASDTYGTPNPMLSVEKPRFKKKPGQRLTRDQARLLLTAVKTDLEWALVTCYFGLRFRRIEAERLLSGAVRSDVIAVDGKERGEELPLLPVFRDMLLRIENHGPDGRHFPLKGDCMAYHIRQIGKRVNMRVTPHMLRNTAAALWYYYGGDKESNRMLLRHGTDDMTDHYSNEFLEELRIKDQRHNPMLNLMRELDLVPAATQFGVIKPLTNTTGVRETEAASQTEDITSLMEYVTSPTTDPALKLPDLLDHMIALGNMAQEIKHSLGGNGHWPARTDEIIEYLKHQARK